MLELLPFGRTHFQVLQGWFASQREVVQWGGPAVSYPLTLEQLEAMLDEGRGPKPARLCWMAQTHGAIVGHAQLGMDWQNGNAVLSRVATAPDARGRGYAAPMLRLVLNEAFAFARIERVELNVYAWNTLAIRTYERLGFTKEGVRRSSALVDGERWDTAIMGLLRPDWSRSD